MSKNFWHDIETWTDVPEIINAIVEIPKGSMNKYEYDKKNNLIKLDRVLFSPFHYPGDYGLIPQTLSEDGDPLDALVLVTNPTFPGILIESRPIGLLQMKDDGEPDDKIICVSTNDPRYLHTTDIENIEDHHRSEIAHFFQVYKELEGKKVEIIGWKSAKDAKSVIIESIKRYKETLKKLALKAYARTAAYDSTIANWMSEELEQPLGKFYSLGGVEQQNLRYGENPHQKAKFYNDGSSRKGLITSVQLQGKELSYNNINDTNAAFELVSEFDPEEDFAVAIIKHANPCGVAKGENLLEAYTKALRCDSVSAFGGIIALNKKLDETTAKKISEISILSLGNIVWHSGSPILTLYSITLGSEPTLINPINKNPL